jgi:threonine dehydratase
MFSDWQTVRQHKLAPPYLPQVQDIVAAAAKLDGVIDRTPLMKSQVLSERFHANIYLKREDLQVVRSFKIRGAYNKIISLSEQERALGVVCASAGNHSQGVAYACAKLNTQGMIFMPTTTPLQKVKQTRYYGKGLINIELVGNSFDDAFHAAQRFQRENGATLVHSFDDPKVIEGQGTVGLEILQDCPETIDLLVMPLGGGGLASGVSAYFRAMSPHTTLMGVEPEGAAAMKASFDAQENITLDKINTFVDGAAVRRVGETTFKVCRYTLDHLSCVHEGKICSTILTLYNEQAIIAEPAGALSIAALDDIKDSIVGKNVVCILSGGNNDITRTEEIKERALLHEGRKHYFVVNFPQRAGALREFLVSVLGPNDDIVHFEYSKKNNREKGPAIVGLELTNKDDLNKLHVKMNEGGFQYEYLNENQVLFNHWV